jgi:La domain
MAHSKAELKKQVEYYLSDKNLVNDRFFHEKLTEAGKDGWMELSFILACNKIKQFKLKKANDEVAEAVKDSAEVEVSADKTKIRRKGSKALPELSASKKRDAKAASKEVSKKESAKEEEDKLPELDARGNPVLANADFENPIIVHFKATKPAADFKISWKEVETAVRKDFPRLKIVYSRADPQEGDLAFSSHRVNSAELDKLTQTTLKI